MLPLFQQCLTFLYRSDKDGIEDWGLPESITNYLRTNLDCCCGCGQVFVGPVRHRATSIDLWHAIADVCPAWRVVIIGCGGDDTTSTLRACTDHTDYACEGELLLVTVCLLALAN